MKKLSQRKNREEKNGMIPMMILIPVRGDEVKRRIVKKNVGSKVGLLVEGLE